jgi:hypothetical protein
MRTAIFNDVELAAIVAPADELLAQTRESDGLFLEHAGGSDAPPAIPDASPQQLVDLQIEFSVHWQLLQHVDD